MSTPVLRITSRHNPHFKEWLRCTRRCDDPQSPWLPVEGSKAVGELVGRLPGSILCYSGPSPPADVLRQAGQAFELSEELFARLSSLKTPQGLLGFFPKPVWSWEDMGSYLLFLDRLQDPGNLGTLLRTARATGLFHLAAAAGTVSFFNPKVVRASASTLFSVPFLQGVELDELIRRGYTCWAADPLASQSLYGSRLEPPLAVVIGSEGSGVGAPVRSACGGLKIPMAADLDSLNAAVAGSLIMYETLRQATLERV